ncbi:uncharacterized protein LOC100204710 isoform X1 [Hydra vulgaris]|uniref:uncharacterized protein LOC100204710 isoform X1 n=1 Tax=Hydra vulgaris TaxID=6087 RepID=UPI001F5E609E|nr:uncharacterized protein LOC100204710 [Hydra vulgaris]
MELNQDDCNEFDSLKVKKLSRDVLTTLADELPRDWKTLARFLNISDIEIDRVLHECSTTREKIYEIFNSWCRNNPNKKWRDIKSGLIFCERKDVISECEKKLTVRSIFGVQTSSENFFSREKLISEIHLYLSQDTKTTLVLYGMSGVGKTHIARKYCETFYNFYENFVWIDAGFGKLQTSMHNLCQILGINSQDSRGEYFNIEVIVEKIHNFYKNEKTLYIFDNVDDESVKNLKMYISKKPKSFSLITSQWKTWSNNVNKMLVDVFSSEEAFVYVKSNLKENTNEDIQNLIKELGYHPFAITQAIKYINIHEVSIEKYLNRYKLKPLEILDTDFFPTEEESRSAIKAINLVLLKLEKKNTFTFKILNCISHCDGQKISKLLITQISNHMEINEEYLIDEAIGLLMSYSLINSLGDEKYSMHELTQLSCRCFQNRSSTTNTYLDLIKSYFVSELNEVNEHVDYGNHFVFHFLHMFQISKKIMSTTFHQMTSSIRYLLVSKGLFEEAIELLTAIQCFNVETYGENNELTLDTKQNIALCFKNMGKYNEALEICYSVDKIKTEILGFNHPSTTLTKHYIASCLSNLGKDNEALELYHSVEKIETEILSINHLDTMETKYNIANCLKNMGKYTEALEIYYSVNKKVSETLGINHSFTLKTKFGIAMCLQDMGKYNEALENYFTFDKKLSEIYGINHPEMLIIKHCMARCLNDMGKYNEALEIYYSVDKLQTEVLGINHPSTLITKNSIAGCLIETGMFNKALEVFYSIDKIQTESLGIENSFTMTIKSNIGSCLIAMGKYNEALEIHNSVHKIRTEILGINHPSTITTKNKIAVCLHEMGKYNEALEIYYSIDKIQSQVFGLSHPLTMTIKNNIACCLNKMGKINESLEILYSVDKIKTESLGINHPDTMLSKHNIASNLKDLGKHNEALEIYYSVNKIEAEILDSNHPSVLITKHNIALCLNALGKYKEALEIFKFVEKIQTEVLGINHPSTIATKKNIALCLNNLEKQQTSCLII